MGRELLFVYGTLMTRAAHPLGELLREHARFVDLGSIQARLYHINDPDDPARYYPGAVPSPFRDDRVHGELYEVLRADHVYSALDHYEGCSPDWPEPHEFLRRRVQVRLVCGAEHVAACYLYTWDLATAQRIEKGIYSQSFVAR